MIKRRSLVQLIILVIAVAFAAVVLFTGTVTVSLGDDTLTVGASMAGKLVLIYADIDSISLESDMDIGKRVRGIGSSRLQAGDFESSEFGRYKLYSCVGTGTYIVVRYDGGVLVFNLRDTAATEEAYRRLLDRI